MNPEILAKVRSAISDLSAMQDAAESQCRECMPVVKVILNLRELERELTKENNNAS